MVVVVDVVVIGERDAVAIEVVERWVEDEPKSIVMVDLGFKPRHHAQRQQSISTTTSTIKKFKPCKY